MIRLRVLGSTEIRSDRSEIASLPAAPKRLALLVYLALARPRGFQRRDKLLVLFWPERGQKSARNALSNLLYHIREAVGSEVIVNRGAEEIGVDRKLLWTDAVAFEEALDREDIDQALGLYRGELLEGFHVPDADPSFHHWLEREREHLRTRAAKGAWRLAEAAEQEGDFPEARQWAKRAAALAPYDEESQARVITLLNRHGDRAGALSAYELYAARLRREWEIEPSGEIRALAERVRATDRAPANPTGREAAGARAPEDEDPKQGRKSRPRPYSELPDAEESREHPPGRGDDIRTSNSGDDSQEAHPGRPPERLARQGLSSRRGRMFYGAAIVLVFVLVLAWVSGTGGRFSEAPPEIVDRSIAVLPFEVSGSGAETWRDGMVTMLSTGLDGAGGLRAISDRTVFAAWERAELEKNEVMFDRELAIARNLGARYAVVGSAVVLGSELRLTASVLETASAQRLGQAQVQGTPRQVMSLADELTRKVLSLLLERSDDAIPSVHVASMGTRSLRALKFFLDGERHFRIGRYDKAVEAFDAAIEEDSTFGLAYARQVTARGWAQIPGGGRMLRQAYELSQQLPPRDRRRVQAIYLRNVIGRPLAATDSLRSLATDYPDDPFTWYELGEALYHGGIPGGHIEAERAFEAAARIDPGIAQYHHHLVDIAFIVHRDSALAARRIAAHPGPQVRMQNQISLELVFGTPKQRAGALARLDTLSAVHDGFPFGGLLANLYHPTDRALQERVLRVILGRKDITSRLLVRYLGINLLDRGRLKSGLAYLRDVGSAMPVAGALSIGYPIPDSDVRKLLDTSGFNGSPSVPDYFYAGVQVVARGRSDELDTIIRQMHSTDREGVESKIEELQGYRAWKAGDLEQAARMWSNSFVFQRVGPIWRGDLYRELGHFERAEAWYIAAWEHPLAHERLGLLYDQMGRRKDALGAYRRFIEAWADADPDLQNRVRAARERVLQLSNATS